MRFLVDENLPRRVATWISAEGHDAQHVSDLGLMGQPDTAILAEAVRLSACIVTRDADFVSIAMAEGDRVSVVRLLIGNCATAVLIARLTALWPDILERLARGERVIQTG